MQLHFGKKEFGFFPQTFILPFDMKLLKRAWEEGGSKQKWIIKPVSGHIGVLIYDIFSGENLASCSVG